MNKEKLEKAVEWANMVVNPDKSTSDPFDPVWIEKVTEGGKAAAEFILEKHEFESRIVEIPVTESMIRISVDDKHYTMEEVQTIIREVNQKANAKIYKPQPLGPPIEAVVIGGRYFTMDEYKEMMKEGDPRV
ncbi:hypothetical protein phi16_gp061 [Corynebacterium phage phi16]|uniref:hypothetical protein n=1 Tax=Corynebacterium glutamicum TaxID=1718 RepID=UPI000941D2D9|nr:hypothetical protein [Corynebacterium glutamicum]APQ42564.1 hypothetical protein phi16_gp061 [Corynebacterium phage phi16]OKX80532.1 hypothetical protein AUO95_10325 [Corynebacterium glutamicum]